MGLPLYARDREAAAHSRASLPPHLPQKHSQICHNTDITDNNKKHGTCVFLKCTTASIVSICTPKRLAARARRDRVGFCVYVRDLCECVCGLYEFSNSINTIYQSSLQPVASMLQAKRAYLSILAILPACAHFQRSRAIILDSIWTRNVYNDRVKPTHTHLLHTQHDFYVNIVPALVL